MKLFRKRGRLYVYILATGLVFLLYTGRSLAVYHQKAGQPSREKILGEIKLPQGVQKLSPLVSGMGEHWANPENLPVGPIYLVHEGEVIGVEYMFTADLMEEVTLSTPEGEERFKELSGLPVGAQVDHMDIEFMPRGHEGFEVPHFDVHLYFLSTEERRKIVTIREISMSSGNFFFEPKNLVLRKGQPVRIVFQNSGVHTFTIDELGVNENLRGSEITVEFTPNRSGTFEYYCRYHGGMLGQVKVE
ncbi:MAG: cupredoxin domain-containing protein [bacterium]